MKWAFSKRTQLFKEFIVLANMTLDYAKKGTTKDVKMGRKTLLRIPPSSRFFTVTIVFEQLLWG